LILLICIQKDSKNASYLEGALPEWMALSATKIWPQGRQNSRNQPKTAEKNRMGEIFVVGNNRSPIGNAGFSVRH
jgi:hypothetical protein